MPGSRRARWSGIRAVSIATLATPIAASRRSGRVSMARFSDRGQAAASSDSDDQDTIVEARSPVNGCRS